MSDVETPVSYVKGQICTKPFPDGASAPQIKNGLAYTARHRLVELEVVCTAYDNDFVLRPGAKVFVRSGDAAAPWAKELFEHPDFSFIVVPSNRVVYTTGAVRE